MAANDYYTSHPQSSNFPPDYPTQSTTTSYEPYRQSSHPAYPYSLGSSPGSSSQTSSNDTTTSDRGFLTPGHSSGPKLKKSKSDRAIKFVEKQVKKQIDKKLHGGSHQGGSGQQGQQLQDHIIEATQGDSSGQQGGEYGYGDASGGYGATGGDYGASSGSGAGAGGEYGYGDSSGGYGLTGDFGGGEGGGNFDFGGGGGEGWLESLGLGDLGDLGDI